MLRSSVMDRLWIGCGALITVFALAPVLGAATTLENLQVAFNGESNAHARYIAYARRADKEGYADVANLFRAAARAEQIHASNHAEVIRAMNAEPRADVTMPEVNSTRENLEAAIKGENDERDRMYPEFLKKARADGNTRAVRTLNLAKTAEGEHSKLFQSALEQLEKSKGAPAAAYYVCPVCGFTARTTGFDKCPSCFTAKERFEKIA